MLQGASASTATGQHHVHGRVPDRCLDFSVMAELDQTKRVATMYTKVQQQCENRVWTTTV